MLSLHELLDVSLGSYGNIKVCSAIGRTLIDTTVQQFCKDLDTTGHKIYSNGRFTLFEVDGEEYKVSFVDRLRYNTLELSLSAKGYITVAFCAKSFPFRQTLYRHKISML